MSRRALLIGVAMIAACYPTTTRPAFMAEPGSYDREIELPLDRATTSLALALDADSIPVRRTEPKDGWLETDWFDAHTLKPVTGRVLGPDIVKVRAFVAPSRNNYSDVMVETVYRPEADPSVAPRELERQVARNHPIALRMVTVLQRMVDQYGGISIDSTPPNPKAKRFRPPVRPDSLADSIPKRPDSAMAHIDTIKPATIPLDSLGQPTHKPTQR